MRTSRGKTASGEWIFGDSLSFRGKTFIFSEADFDYCDEYGCLDGYAREVISETVGDCTGLKDLDGNLIYEGDICIYYMPNLMSYKGVIVWLKECACFSFHGKGIERMLRDTNFKIKVIGNIHDNPDLEDKK